MLKTILLTALTLGIAIGGGAASVWYALHAQEGVGAVTVGAWTAFPNVGTPAADPYSKARNAREAVLSLGVAEGLTFVAQRDSGGEALARNCAYRIEGTFPSARFWTIHAADASQPLIRAERRKLPALHSLEILRQADNSVSISVGPRPASGNWLATGGNGPMTLMLTLYDTPITSNTGISDITLPEIAKVACDD